MTVEKLVDELITILEVHPDCADAEVWGELEVDGKLIKDHFKYIRYDKHHKPFRLILE